MRNFLQNCCKDEREKSLNKEWLNHINEGWQGWKKEPISDQERRRKVKVVELGEEKKWKNKIEIHNMSDFWKGSADLCGSWVPCPWFYYVRCTDWVLSDTPAKVGLIAQHSGMQSLHQLDQHSNDQLSFHNTHVSWGVWRMNCGQPPALIWLRLSPDWPMTSGCAF